MKLQIMGLAGAALLVSACGHRRAAPPPVQPVTVSKPALPAGFIAQCGHAGAPNAALAYPAGWNARLNRTVPEPGPATVVDELLGGEKLPPAVKVDTNLQPISPPIPTYPDSAAAGMMEAECNVLFDVDVSGAVVNPLVACSNRAFVDEARRAVQSVSFAPKREDGRDLIRWNVIYPIQFCMSDPRARS